MPKKNQKSNQLEVADDFDGMLADFRAADLANASPTHVAQSAANKTSANATRAHVHEKSVSEATILAAIRAGDLARLRRWHRQGVRYPEEVVCVAAELGSIYLCDEVPDRGARC